MTFHNVIILSKLVSNKDKNNYCYNMFSEKLLMIYLKIKFLYKILKICYDRIDFCKGINVNSTSKSKEYVICQYFFLKKEKELNLNQMSAMDVIIH